MAEYCRDCSIRYLGPETAKYAGGLCKKGETTTMLYEGCGDIIEVDHKGRRAEGDHNHEQNDNSGYFKRILRWWT